MREFEKKRKSKAGIFVKLLVIAVIASFAYISKINPVNSLVHDNEYDNGTPLVSEIIEPEYADAISSDGLYSSNAILVRLIDNEVLMEYNMGGKIYPASLTKIMTVIVAIENLQDLNEVIKLTDSTFEGLYEANASMAGFLPNEKVRAIDLLYGVMLPSGAECCKAISEYISGSEKSFVKLMNQKAKELGMDSTHFANTSGLHDDNHYTTVKDLAILLSYALQNDTFREIFTTFRYSMPPTNMHTDGITFYSTMYSKLGDRSIIDGTILGGKTGYTNEAGLCLASLAIVDGQEYILITAGANGNHNTEQYNITDAFSVYNSISK